MHESETTDGAAFLARCKAFEGREVDALVAPDPVNQAMIRHWVEAMGDAIPVYRTRRPPRSMARSSPRR
jgi:hypothetical protein